MHFINLGLLLVLIITQGNTYSYALIRTQGNTIITYIRQLL